MPSKTVYTATIEHLQILNEQGQLDEKLAKDTLTDQEVLDLYQFMIRCRALDEVAFKLQRSGLMGTYSHNQGQEACAVGSPFTHRSLAARRSRTTYCGAIACCSL